MILDRLKGKIEFSNVCFSYDKITPVLNDVSFRLNPGETLAIVGETGAGKTTIINALCRFYELSSGHILIDDHDIKTLELNEYRKNLGLVLQDVFLFSGSISENISMGNSAIGQGRIEESAKAIGADEFIEALPGSYQFNPMERGVSLSMGQRQLVSFIRAMAFDPKILILDEATSSVDSATEQLVQKAITRLLKNRTSIIIAHRLSTIQHANRIIVMNNGYIIEQGTHESLLQKKGEYYRLYETQFKLQEIS
jgi:ATP-binding cassette subfamily B protein